MATIHLRYNGSTARPYFEITLNGITMKIRSVTKLTMVAAVLLHTSLGYAEDLFDHSKPVAFKPMQTLAPTQTVGGYPILSTGGNLVILDLRTSFAG